MELCVYCGREITVEQKDDRMPIPDTNLLCHGTCRKEAIDNIKNRYYKQDGVR